MALDNKKPRITAHRRFYRVLCILGAVLLCLCVALQARTKALENHLYTESSHTLVEKLPLPTRKHGDIGIVSAFYDREVSTYQIRLSKSSSDLSTLDIPQIYLVADGNERQAYKVTTVFYEDLHGRTDAVLLFSNAALGNRITFHIGSMQYEIISDKYTANSGATEPNLGFHSESENQDLPTTQSGNDLEKEDILSQIKESVGIPFRLWNNQSQVLHCISFFESYAKREVERKTDPAHEEQNALEWDLTGNILSVSGTWNEAFEVDMSSKTATSLADGMVYDIVPGNIIDGHYTK